MKESRLFKILYYILERGKVTAKELSDKFEVSIRTIYRDIDVISSAGIPIYATQGKGGGIEIADDFVLKKSLLSESEQEQILSALKSLEKTNEIYENELLTKLSALFKKKNPNWVEVDFTNWQRKQIYEELFNDIKSSIINKNVIHFRYFASNEGDTEREVKPIRLFFKGWDWYLYGFCLLRNDFRYFKLSRIKEFEKTLIKFDDDFDNIILKKEIKNEDTVLLKLKFDKRAAFRVYDENFVNIRKDKEGNLYTEIEIPNDYSLYSYIFSFGDRIEVLEPKEIRNKIKTMLENISKKYIN